ncbi:MAG: S8 family serine peptidase, partial [Acidobacteriota bacterium]
MEQIARGGEAPPGTAFETPAFLQNNREAMDPSLLKFGPYKFDPSRGLPALPSLGVGMGTGPKGGGQELLLIVQHDGVITKEWREQLLGLGAEILDYMPNNAYVVRVAAANQGAVRTLPGTRAVEQYPPAFKLGAALEELITEPGGPYMSEFNGAIAPDGTVALRIGLAQGRTKASLVPGLNPNLEVVYSSEEDGLVVVRVDVMQLAGLVHGLIHNADVYSVDVVPPMKPMNYTRTAYLQSANMSDHTIWAQGLTGYGQIAALYDNPCDTGSCYLRYSDVWCGEAVCGISDFPTPNCPDNKVISIRTYLLAACRDIEPGVLPGSGGTHGTWVASSIVGDDFGTNGLATELGVTTTSPEQFGMAPGAQLVVFSEDIGDPSLVGWYTQVGVNYAEAIFHWSYEHANALTKSGQNEWGAYIGARAANYPWGYDYPSIQYDEFAFRTDNALWYMRDFLLVTAAGDAGPNSGTLNGGPQVAKNALTVGAADAANPENVDATSSHGMTLDGRLKPEVIAFSGTTMAATGSQENQTTPTCLTGVYTGTSVASALVTGAAVLVGEYFMDGYYPSGADTRGTPIDDYRDQVFPVGSGDSFSPSSALVKAMLINSCRNMTGNYTATTGGGGASAPRPTGGQGWGRMVLDDVLSFSGESDRQVLVLNDVYNGATTLTDASGIPLAHGMQPRASLETGQRHTFTVQVDGGGAVGNTGEGGLKITLAWSDPTGAIRAAFPAINNLNLRAWAPDGTLYVGNNFTAGSAPWTAAGLVSPDNLNNVECIFLDKPTISGSKVGPWTIEVLGANIPGNGRVEQSRPGGGEQISSVFQGYALVVVGNVAAGDRARLSWDKTAYTCDDQAVVYMKDTSLAKSNFDIVVRVYDYAGNVYDKETLTVLPGPGPMWETPAIDVTDSAPTQENGILELLHGFVVEARHADEDPPGYEAVASTTANCAVRLWLAESQLSGGCDGSPQREEFIDRWEIVTITHTVKLAQLEDVTDLWIDVVSLNPNVRVLMEAAYIGVVRAGATFQFSFTVQEWTGLTNPGDLVEFKVLGWSPADGLSQPSGYNRTYELERDWSEEYYNTNYPTGTTTGVNPWTGGTEWNDLTAAPGGNVDVPATGFCFDTEHGGTQGWASASFWCAETYNCCSNHDYVWAEGPGAAGICGAETLYRLPLDTGGTGTGSWVQHDESYQGTGTASCQSNYCFGKALSAPEGDPTLCQSNDPIEYECFKACGGGYFCYNYNFGVLRSPVIEKVHPFVGGIPHQHSPGCTEWHLEFLRSTHWSNYNYMAYGRYPTGASNWFAIIIDGDTADQSQCSTTYYLPTQWNTTLISRCCWGNCDFHGRVEEYCWWWQHAQHTTWDSGDNKWAKDLHADDPGYKDPKVNPHCVPDNLGPEEDQILTPFGQIGDSFRWAIAEWGANWSTPDCVPPYQFGPGGITCPSLPRPPGLGGYFIDNWNIEWTEFQAVDDPTPLTSPCGQPDIWFQPKQYSVCTAGARAEIWVQDIAGKYMAGQLVVRVRSFNTGDVEDFVLLETPTLGLFRGYVPMSTEVLPNPDADKANPVPGMDNVLYVTTADNLIANYDPDGVPDNGDEVEAIGATECPTVSAYYLKHVAWDTDPCADNDGWLDGGERADVVVSINNVSQEVSLVGAEVSLRTNDPAVSMCKNGISFGTVPPLTVVDNAADPFEICADDALISWPETNTPYLVEFDVHITADNSQGAPTRQLMVMALDVEADDTGCDPVPWSDDFQTEPSGQQFSALMDSGVVPLGRMNQEPDNGLCPLVADFCGDAAEGAQYREVNDWNITHTGTQLRPEAGGIKGDLPPIDHTDGTGKCFANNHGYDSGLQVYGGVTPLKVDYAYTKGYGGAVEGVAFALCGEDDPTCILAGNCCSDGVDNDSDGATDIADRTGYELRFWHMAHM